MADLNQNTRPTIKAIRAVPRSGGALFLAELFCVAFSLLAQCATGAQPAPRLTEAQHQAVADLKELGLQVTWDTDSTGRQVAYVVGEFVGSNAAANRLAPLAKLGAVTQLSLDDVTAADFEILGKLADLERVRLTVGRGFEKDSPVITSDEVKALTRLPKLAWLELRSNKFDGPAIEALHELASLRKLKLDGGDLTDENLQRLNCPTLDELQLDDSNSDSGAALKGTSFKEFGRFKQLQTLSVHSESLELKTIVDLRSLPRLTAFVCDGPAWQTADVSVLTRLPHIERVYLEPVDVDQRDLRPLARVKTLKLLSVSNRYKRTKTADVDRVSSQLPGVRVVLHGPVNNPLAALENPKITALMITPEDMLRSRKIPVSNDAEAANYFDNGYLILDHKPVNAKELQQEILGALSDQNTYEPPAGYAGCFEPGLAFTITDGDATYVALVCLKCNGIEITRRSPQLWRHFDNRIDSDQIGGAMGDGGLERMTKLYVRLWGKILPESRSYVRVQPHTGAAAFGGELTDKDGQPKFHDLFRLNLDDTEATDETLSFVAKYADLHELWLRNTKVSDAGLTVLGKLKNLESLDLRGTKVSNEAAAVFQKDHPKVTIFQ